ncbi:MAG TPA: phosphatase PAP2 family protein [Solirubrobacteraceae bacterium]
MTSFRSTRRSRATAIGGLLAGACAGGALLALIWVAVRRPTPGVDRRAFDLLATTRGSLLARAVKLLADLGPPLAALFVLLLLAVLAIRRRWLDAAVIVVGYPLVAVADHIAKAADARPRPPGSLIVAGGYSFPSAEAALSVGLLVIAIVIARLIGHPAGRVLIWAAGLLIVLIGALLISVRVHYLTDVLAGWALGAAGFALAGAGALALDELRDRRLSRS